ncbi:MULTISPECIES: hypothetical protein [Clostridium]|jgi:hypothetical protein|uniref:hypothetical protein n=1 Tax=Clostridium TaxID=1485 RepID=UPI00189F2CC9|nr:MULTISPECIES: hypothetical protein [Clostridium]MBS5307187.1 hypothetical protein [Clostridium sp.]MDB1945171.1 hypothetical protein [Clostridium tertium]MDB1948464.1 hypothetical protein [Clostridium tertium]MDB1952455.1 hypothetical protein [Clostridium tertium]MDB1954806.1 hypothetical protein [Clostridium tertium]
MKKVMPFLFTGNQFNLRNIVVYVNNNTSKILEDVTIQHTGPGGHPINLGTIKPNSNDTQEEICSTTIVSKSELLFSYVLGENRYNLVVYDDIINTDIRPIVITITEEDNNLVFNTERVAGKDI